MIKVISTALDGTVLEGSEETYRDLLAVANCLANDAAHDYTDRVIKGLKEDGGITIPNGLTELDVWSVVE
jgi:hypothetical protein